MILVDDRVGAVELVPYFKPYDVPVSVGRLEFGDLCWTGNGPDGPVMVGVERKTLHDLVGSMRSKRLSGHQLPGLMEMYQHVYLLVEGIMRAGDHGQADIYINRKRDWVPLLVGSKPILYREIDHYLTTLHNLCNITVKETSREEQSVAWIVSQYKWWEKDYNKHRAHQEIYAPAPERARGRRGLFGVRAANIVEKVAAQLPGVDRKAFEVSKKFKTVEQMVNAEVRKWEEVNGIGKKMAENIYGILRGL